MDGEVNIIKISIIVPVYNVEKYVADCLESLLRQDFPDYEVILVDDGSTDASGDICDEFAKKNDRVHTFHQKNCGVSAARNIGLQMAKGDYIVFVDPDDWVNPDYLSSMAAYMQPGGMAACSVVREKCTTHPSRNNSLCHDKEMILRMNKERAELSVLNWNELSGGCVAKMFDNSVISKNKIQFLKGAKYYEDYLFVMQYLSCTTRETVWIKRQAYHYRRNPQSATGVYHQKQKKIDMKYFSVIEMLEKGKEYVEDTMRLRNAIQARSVWEKIKSVHMMYLNGWEDQPLYKSYLHDIRKDFAVYLKNTDGGEPLKRKAASFMCCIHPAIFHIIWKIFSKKE